MSEKMTLDKTIFTISIGSHKVSLKDIKSLHLTFYASRLRGYFISSELQVRFYKKKLTVDIKESRTLTAKAVPQAKG